MLRYLPFVFVISCVLADCTVDPTLASDDVPVVEHAIGLLEPLKLTKTIKRTDKGTYFLRICSNAVTDKNNDKATVVLQNGKDKTTLGLYNRTSAIIGYNFVEFSFGSNVKYPDDSECGGMNMSVRLTVYCEEEQSISYPAYELLDPLPGDCFTHFSTEHPLGCLHPHKQTGLGGFSIFLIIMMVCAVVYFVGGFFYLRYYKRVQGADQIPHHRLWFSFGNKFADVTSSLCRCDRYCGGDSDMYATVEGREPLTEGTPYEGAGTPYQDIDSRPSYQPPFDQREPLLRQQPPQPLTQPDANLILP